MVRRFVEQHHVRAHQKNAGQRHAHLPAARERADIAVHHGFREGETGQHFAGTAIQGIAVELLVARLHLAVALDDRVHLVHTIRIDHGRFKFAQFGGDFADRPCPVHDLGHGRAAGHFAYILTEIADGHAFIDGDLALIRQLVADDHPEQRGLASTIRPDKADLLTTIECCRGLDEEDAVAELLGDVFDADHG